MGPSWAGTGADARPQRSAGHAAAGATSGCAVFYAVRTPSGQAAGGGAGASGPDPTQPSSSDPARPVPAASPKVRNVIRRNSPQHGAQLARRDSAGPSGLPACRHAVAPNPAAPPAAGPPDLPPSRPCAHMRPSLLLGATCSAMPAPGPMTADQPHDASPNSRYTQHLGSISGYVNKRLFGYLFQCPDCD